jgi:hypothetical protein
VCVWGGGGGGSAVYIFVLETVLKSSQFLLCIKSLLHLYVAPASIISTRLACQGERDCIGRGGYFFGSYLLQELILVATDWIFSDCWIHVLQSKFESGFGGDIWAPDTVSCSEWMHKT